MNIRDISSNPRFTEKNNRKTFGFFPIQTISEITKPFDLKIAVKVAPKHTSKRQHHYGAEQKKIFISNCQKLHFHHTCGNIYCYEHLRRLIPAGIYMLKVNNRNTGTRCEICSKLTIKIPERRHWRRSGVFIVNFEHISHLALVFLLLTLNM